MIWTPDNITQLRRLWLSGMRTGEIACQLGMTKNAIVGKAHRIGLPNRPNPVDQAKLRAKRAEEAARQRGNRDGCKFIESHDYLDVIAAGGSPFCGKPVSEPGGSWCHHHRARVFTKKADPEAFAAD